MTAVVVQQVLLKYIQRSLLKPAVQRYRKVMRLRKEKFRDYSEEKKSAKLLKNVTTLVQVVFLLQSVNWQQD